MKFIKSIILASAIMASAINLGAAERSISFPSCSILVKEGAKKQVTEFRIVKVSASSEHTAITCELYFLKKLKDVIHIDSGCSLFYQTADSVVRSRIKVADGLQICKRGETQSQEPSNYKRGDKLEFTMFFDPLPENVDSFDLIDGLFSDRNRVDISLTDGAASGEEQRIGTCPYEDVIKEATFNGQDKNSFPKWVTARLQYPDSMRWSKQEGRVTLEITIEEDGIASYQIVKAAQPAFNAEAIRVVASAPGWAPASIRGKPVVCTFTFPVIFRLK